ncbi:hypothetical protein D3C81_1763320 [compost metagenome]
MLTGSAPPYFSTVALLGHLSLPLATVLSDAASLLVSHYFGFTPVGVNHAIHYNTVVATREFNPTHGAPWHSANGP